MSEAASHYIWASQPSERLRGGITRRFVTTASTMLGQVLFQKGHTVPPHAHVNEQFTHVVSGCLRFALGSAGEQIVVVNAGEVIVIPPNLLHAVEAMDNTLEDDIFNPPRQDWIDPVSVFLRG